MTGIIHQEDGMNYELLMDGFSEAVSNYTATLAEIDPACFTRPGGPSENEQQTLKVLNPDVIVPGALMLTEDEQIIAESSAFQEADAEGYVERQYVFDVAVGEAVAQNLFAVVNSLEARKKLPDKTVALFEVNANRGFRRGREDDAGCYGLPLDWLGHVVVDAYYAGEEAVNKSSSTQNRRIDYMGEPGSWRTTFGTGLERNAARIRIRPTYPKTFDYSLRGIRHDEAPREIFEARRLVTEGTQDEDSSWVYPEWSVLRGEYSICRAVCMLHDLTDWSPEDFQSYDELWERERQDFTRWLTEHVDTVSTKQPEA